MKIAVLAVVMIVSASLCAAAKDKGGIGPQTDFKNMSPEQVLLLLQNAGDLAVKGKGADFEGCNGKNKTWEGGRELRCEDVTIDLGTNVLGGKIEENLRSIELLVPTMIALFRGCGIYATDPNNSAGGRTCAGLGRAFFTIGNKDAAIAVWERAPGCYGYSRGVQINTCFSTASYLDPGDREFLKRIARQQCDKLHDREPCEYLSQMGENVDMGAVAQAEQDNRETVQEFRAQRKAEMEAAQNRQSTLLTVLQGMPNANNPNAIVDAGDRQATEIRAVGNANAAGKQSTSTYSTAPSYAPKTASPGNSGVTNNPSSGNPSNSGTTASSPSASPASQPQTVAAVPQCITVQTKGDGTFTLSNFCLYAVNVSFTQPGDSLDADASLLQNEAVHEGDTSKPFRIWACPSPYTAIDLSTNHQDPHYTSSSVACAVGNAGSGS